MGILDNVNLLFFWEGRGAVATDNDLILVGLGANLANKSTVSPLATCQAALTKLREHGVHEHGSSGWYVSAPVPQSDQNWYINKVSIIQTHLNPEKLLETLLAVEQCFGRVRSERWGQRPLDLDLLAFKRIICKNSGKNHLNLPHPRMLKRRFVVDPLVEIAPQWSHPLTRKTIKDVAKEMQQEQKLLGFSSTIPDNSGNL